MSTSDELEYRTTERPIPGKISSQDFQKHLARYGFAGEFVDGKQVLDIGSGVGFGGLFYLTQRRARHVVNMEINFDAVAWGKKRFHHSGLSFLQMDAERIAFRANTFDVVSAFEVLEHVEHYDAFLKETHRVLKKGGTFIVSTPNKFVYSHGLDKPVNEYHFKEFYYEEIKEVLSEKFIVLGMYGQRRKKVTEIQPPTKVTLLTQRLYKYVPIQLVKLYKKMSSKYNYTPHLDMPVDPAFQVQPCESSEIFHGKTEETFSVIIAVCEKK